MSRSKETFIDSIEIFTLGGATHANMTIDGKYISDWARTSEIRSWNNQDRRGAVSQQAAQIFFADRLLKKLARFEELGFM